MTEKSEALRLADALEVMHYYEDLGQEAATILRQLHEANEAFGKRQEWWNERMFVLEQQRDALLEALKLARPYISTYTLDGYHAEVKADAAIKAVEENT